MVQVQLDFSTLLVYVVIGIGIIVVGAVMYKIYKHMKRARSHELAMLEELLRKEELQLRALELVKEDRLVKYIVERPELRSKVVKALEKDMKKTVHRLIVAAMKDIYINLLRERWVFYFLAFLGGVGGGILLAETLLADQPPAEAAGGGGG